MCMGIQGTLENHPECLQHFKFVLHYDLLHYLLHHH